jgi:tetratricopeptide (TPR) repeat protein
MHDPIRRILVPGLCALAALAACSRGARAPAPAPPGPGAAAAMPGMARAPATLADWARGAQLFEGLGSFHRPISTRSPEAQQYFDQGMRLLWAFNHDESTRSFARAAELDPDCAICLWGVALTAGPNYNLPMMAEARATIAYDSVTRASALASHASPVEAALIKALAARYPRPAALDPATAGPVLQAYASAMRDVARQFPADLDVQTMYAEALMNTNAWKLWSLDGQPAPGTPEIVAVLESVLARDPRHPGANHYYVHALEASPHPEKAVAAAERLPGMMPAAGHLEHMPAHIMQRVGRYADAAEANRKGAAADRAYLGRTQPPDYYPMYVAHNFQFLAYATAMQGRKADTLAAVKAAREAIPESVLLAMPGADWWAAEYYMAEVRFGAWDQLLAEPRPNPALKALTGGYLFATAVALAERDRVAEAEARLAELEQLRASLPQDLPAGLNVAPDVLALAATLAKAKIAVARADRASAIRLLTDAVAQEDRLAYDEPADWFFPVRHILGEELLKAGRGADAEAVYREDLRRNPANGWSLYGLAKALRAQHKNAAARSTDAQFRDAWRQADVSLTASVL